MASFQDISKARIVKRKVFTASASTPATADVLAVPAPTSFAPYTLATALENVGETAVVVRETIQSHVGATGTIMLTSAETGVTTTVAYTSRTSTTFTIAPTDFSTDFLTEGETVMVPNHNRLVVTGWQVNGYNSGTLVTFTVRGDNPTTAVIFGGVMVATTGSISLNASGMTIPCESNSNVEVAFSGSFTGQLDVTIEGYVMPASTPMAISYTMVTA